MSLPKSLVTIATLVLTTASAAENLSLDCDVGDAVTGERCRVMRLREGNRLFSEETFGGNGRTCETCHSRKTGTLSPLDVQRLLVRNPGDPLFVHDGTDDGTDGTARISEHATIRVTLPLPPHVRLKNDPTATTVTFLRGIPTTMNTPALDPVLMYDRRDLSLQAQALGAIEGHAGTSAVSGLQLDLIAEFQQQDPRFFSRPELRHFARGNKAAPVLPEGETDAERRGRRFFVDAPFAPPSKEGICALCHSGPMLNTANAFSPPVFGNPPGVRDHNVFVSERNVLGLPLYTFLIYDTIEEQPVEVTTPDLGILITPLPKLLQQGAVVPDFILAARGLRRAFFSNIFKTPTLWGIRHTAPYFHDNSAKTLRDMVDHYQFFFDAKSLGVQLTEQDKNDMIAYLRLL